MTGNLTPEQLADLRKSGLTDETIMAAGLYNEADGHKVVELLGNYLSVKVARSMGACIVFPYREPNGDPMLSADAADNARSYVRLKPQFPRIDRRKKKDRARKYEAPLDLSSRAYLPPGTRAALADPSIPLLITEGEKKSLAADQAGFPCIGIAGVWSWQKGRETNEATGKKDGKRELIPDLAAVKWQGRAVYIVFDSDKIDDPLIEAAESHLAAILKANGAMVKSVNIPPGPNGTKIGVDDFLVASGRDELVALIEAATVPQTARRRHRPIRPGRSAHTR